MASLALPAWTHRRHPIVQGETRHWRRSRTWRATLAVLWGGALLFLLVPAACTLLVGLQVPYNNAAEAVLIVGGSLTFGLAVTSAAASGVNGLAAGLLGATLIARERETQSWPFLRLTTLTSLEIVGGKFVALLRTLALPMALVSGLRLLALLVGLGSAALALVASGLTAAQLQAIVLAAAPALTDVNVLVLLFTGAIGGLVALAWWLLEPFFSVVYAGAVGLAASCVARSRGAAIVLSVGVHFGLGLGLYAPVQQLMSLWPLFLMQNPNQLLGLLPALTIVLPVMVQSGLQVAVLAACLVFALRRVEHLSE